MLMQDSPAQARFRYLVGKIVNVNHSAGICLLRPLRPHFPCHRLRCRRCLGYPRRQSRCCLAKQHGPAAFVSEVWLIHPIGTLQRDRDNSMKPGT